LYVYISISLDGEAMLFFDFRADRMREIVQSFGFETKNFEPAKAPKDLVCEIPSSNLSLPNCISSFCNFASTPPFCFPQNIYTFTQYKLDFPFKVLFPPQSMDNVLAEWLGKQKIPQYHVAGLSFILSLDQLKYMINIFSHFFRN